MCSYSPARRGWGAELRAGDGRLQAAEEHAASARTAITSRYFTIHFPFRENSVPPVDDHEQYLGPTPWYLAISSFRDIFIHLRSRPSASTCRGSPRASRAWPSAWPLPLAHRVGRAHGSGGSWPPASLPALVVVCVGCWSTSGPQILQPRTISLGTGLLCLPDHCICRSRVACLARG